MPIVVSTPAESAFLSDLIRIYQIALGRQPDNAGLEYWFAQGKANGLDIVKTTAGFLPPEILTHSPARFVDDLYHSALGRDAGDGHSSHTGRCAQDLSRYCVALSRRNRSHAHTRA